MAEPKQSANVIEDADQDVHVCSELVTEVAYMAAVDESDSESSEYERDAFKEAFLETQRKLVDLEKDLKDTRQYLCRLEDACDNTEQKILEINRLKIAGVLEGSGISIAEDNRSSNVSLEDYAPCYAAVLEGLEMERAHAEGVRRKAGRLESKLEETSSEIAHLLAQLDGDKQVDSDVKELRDNAPYLRDEIAMTAKDECTLHCSMIAKLTEENEALKKDKYFNDALLREVKTLKNECDEIEIENGQLEQEKQSLREELIVLEEKLCALETSQVQRDKTVDEAVSSTQDKLTNAERCLEQLKQQVIDHNEQVEELEESCDQSRTRNIELEKELSVLHIRIQELEESLDAAQKEKQELQLEWKKKADNQMKCVVQMEIQLRDIGREKESTRLQLIACKGKTEMEARNLTKQLNEAQVRCEIFKKEVAEKQRELQACRRDTDRCDNEFSSLKTQLEGANGNITRLNEVNKRLEGELQYLAEHRTMEVNISQGINPSPPPLAESESDLSDFEEEIEVSKCDVILEAAPSEQVEWSDLEPEGQVVEERLMQALEDKKNLEQKLAEAEQRGAKTADELSETIRRLNDRCEELRKELFDKEVPLNQANVDEDPTKAEELKEENEHLEEELEKAHHELAANVVPEDVVVLEEKYELLKKAYDKLLSDSETLQEEHDNVVEEKDSLLMEVDEWQNDFEAGKQKYVKLASENENLKDEKKKLETRLVQLQEELTKKGDLYSKEMENQLKSQRAKIAERLMRLKEETEAEEGFNNKEQAVSDWQEMYSTLRTRFDQMERSKTTVERERDRLQRKCNNVEDELEDVRSKYSRVRREVSDAHGEVSNLRQLLSEYRVSKDAAARELKKQEEQCTKHLKELETITWNISRENNDDGLMVKFESLKLRFEELEGEKESLQKETNSLQYKLHTAEETSAESEVKLSEANEEKQRLEQELKQSQTANTELEIVLQRTTKEKEQEGEQCEWYRNELAKKEATVNGLEQKVRQLETGIKFENEKVDELGTSVALLEQEVQQLNDEIGAKHEKDEVDSGSLRTRVAELETCLETLKADLECKVSELEQVEKEKESLSLHTVELKQEIQCLYGRFEATQAQVAELQRLPQVVSEIQSEVPLEEARVSDVECAPPPEPQNVEKTEITIDIAKPEMELNVLMSGRQPERILGRERKVSIVKIPVNVRSSIVRNGDAVAETVESEESVQVPGSVGILESEPDDEVFPPPPVEELILLDEQVETFTSPSHSTDEQKTPVPTPERIRVSAQALPQLQVPRSLDTRRFPFLTDGVIRLGSGAFQPVPVQSRVIPDERRRISEYNEYNDSRYDRGLFESLPVRPLRALSEPGDIGKMRDLEEELVFSSTPEDRRGQKQRVPPRPRPPDRYPPAENEAILAFESPRGQVREAGVTPYNKAREYDGQRTGPRTDRPRAEVNPYEVRPREYSTPHGSVMEDRRQLPPPPRGKELYPYAKQPRSPVSKVEQRTPPTYEYAYHKSVGYRPLSHDPAQSGPRETGTSPQHGRLNQARRVKQEAHWGDFPDKPCYVRDENYPSNDRNGHYESRSVTGDQRIAPDQGYGTINGRHLLSDDHFRDSYMYMGGVDL